MFLFIEYTFKKVLCQNKVKQEAITLFYSNSRVQDFNQYNVAPDFAQINLYNTIDTRILIKRVTLCNLHKLCAQMYDLYTNRPLK